MALREPTAAFPCQHWTLDRYMSTVLFRFHGNNG